MSKRTIIFALASASILSALAASAALARAPQEAPNRPPRVELKVGQAAKDERGAKGAPSVNVEEVDEEGLLRLLRREGTTARPLLVNFWATWCDPCRDEFPDLVKVDKDFRARGLDFILVSLDDATDIRTAVPAFIEKMRATDIPVYLLNAKDPEAAISYVDRTWHGELPATFLFDPQGQIVYNHKGRINAVELRAAIERTVKSGK